MPSDPCWLPSAIMQTTAALIGIFAVVYVLCVQGLARDASRYPHSKHYRRIDGLFLLLLSLGLLTIYSNYIWLRHLTDGVATASDERGATFMFLFVLLLIGLYTFAMIKEYREKE